MSTKYAVIEHHNSQRSRKRLQKPFTYSFQLIRSNDPDAIELPRGVNREVARYARGKYPVPFVGLKQQRKMEGLV
jgi:hypothetical protein